MMGSETPNPDLLPSDYHSAFLDPPSYSDLIFTPNSPSISPSQSIPSTSSSTSPIFHITVSAPQKEVDPTSASLLPGSPSTFFTYLITTTINDVTPTSSSNSPLTPDAVAPNNHDVIPATTVVPNNNNHDVILTTTTDHNRNGRDVIPTTAAEDPNDNDVIHTSSNSPQRPFLDAVTIVNNRDVVTATSSNNHQRRHPVSPRFGDVIAASSNNDSHQQQQQHWVRRRFRDVVTLADRIADSHRGLFIPLRPDKSLPLDTQSPEFIENRRIAVEKYLRRLAAHPVIGKSDELKAFLFAKGKLPLPTSTDMASRMLDGAVRLPKQLFGDSAAAQVAVQEVVQPAKGGRDLLRIFKELKQSVVTDWGGVRPIVAEEDKEFLEKKAKLHEMEVQLGGVSLQAEGLVKAQQDIGETMGELGLAFIKLTKFETEEAVYNSQRIRAFDTKRVATAAVKASRLYRELNSQTVKHLDTLHEYLGVMLAIQGAFAERASALLTVQTLMSDLSSLQTRAEKHEAASSRIFGGDKSRLRKVDELRETIRVTEDAKNCAIREYERIKENNRSELERIERERHKDYLNMLKGYVMNQIAYSEKLADVWLTLAEESSGYA